MAKKKTESGPGVFMILTLVFFVLASAILGVTTYLGFEGQAKLEEAAKTADSGKATSEKIQREMTARLVINRIAMGDDTPEDRETLSGLAKDQSANILDEHRLLTAKLGANAFPSKDSFYWGLVADLQRGGSGAGEGERKPSPSPKNTVPGIAKLWAKMFQDMRTKYEGEVIARKKAEQASQASQDATDAAKKDFDAKVAALSDEIKAKIDRMDKQFTALKTEADKKGLDFSNIAKVWAAEKSGLEDQLLVKGKENDVLKNKVNSLLNADPSDLEAKWRSFNPAKVTESMGSIAEKSGTFVTLRFKKKMNLVPGQSFVVIPPGTSLVAVIEREKALDKHHYEFASLGAREPFMDNEMIKGMVEITEIEKNGYGARARITFEPNEIRDPIGKNDLIFNLTLSSGAKEHVAYCGIIDLDGDGRPDNEQFVRILENNNLEIDEYLDLKTGERKKRGDGISIGTKFLIVGTDAPLVGNVKKMVDDAKRDGVQLIDARMFLYLIGVKPPKNPAPPAYTTVELGTPGGAAPMPPVIPGKK